MKSRNSTPQDFAQHQIFAPNAPSRQYAAPRASRHTWTTREELRIAIVTWIERTYHRRRRQAGLGRLTPSN